MDAVLILFLTGLISLFVGMLKKPAYSLAVNLLGLVLAFLSFWFEGAYVPVLKVYANALVFNGPQIYLSLSAIFFTLLIMIGNYALLSRDKAHYSDLSALMLFSLSGALCLIGFKDFFMFFIGLEIMSIPVYVLVGSQKDKHSASEAALKYFFTGAFATAILLFGIALVFGATGSFNINEIGFAVMSGIYVPAYMIAGILMILAALLFKVGAFPFHFWNPDVYQGSSKSVMAFMSSVVKIAGFVAIYKLIDTTFQGLNTQWTYFLYIVIIASMFIGYLSAIKQSSLKRLLAYSGISNTGIGLLSLMNGSINGERDLLVFLLGYGASSVLILFISQMISEEDDDLKTLEGIGHNQPFLGIALIVALLSLSGIPPFTGFFGKFLLIKHSIELHPILSIAAILSSVIGAYVYLNLILSIFKSNVEIKPIKTDWSVYSVVILSLIILMGGWILILI